MECKEIGIIGGISSGIEPIYSSTYNRRIERVVSELIEDLDESFAVEEPVYEFEIVPTADSDIYIPEKEKPWQNRRRNHYKAKRRK